MADRRTSRRAGPRGLGLAAWVGRAALTVVLVAWALPAWAATTVAFYSHPWGMGKGGFIYFPHAFVVVERTSDDGTAPAREAYGFTAVSPNAVLLAKKGKGKVSEPDPRYTSVSRLHFQLTLTDEQYAALKQSIADWGDAYDLDNRNCIAFVAALARAVGLEVGEAKGRDPAKFLEAVKKANAARLMTEPPAPLTAPPPAVSAPAS